MCVRPLSVSFRNWELSDSARCDLNCYRIPVQAHFLIINSCTSLHRGWYVFENVFMILSSHISVAYEKIHLKDKVSSICIDVLFTE